MISMLQRALQILESPLARRIRFWIALVSIVIALHWLTNNWAQALPIGWMLGLAASVNFVVYLLVGDAGRAGIPQGSAAWRNIIVDLGKRVFLLWLATVVLVAILTSLTRSFGDVITAAKNASPFFWSMFLVGAVGLYAGGFLGLVSRAALHGASRGRIPR